MAAYARNGYLFLAFGAEVGIREEKKKQQPQTTVVTGLA